MKKFFILLLTTSFIIACNKKSGDDNLKIVGNIEGLSQGKLYLQTVKDSALVTLDSMIIKGNSHFETSLHIEEPQVMYLSLDRGTSLSEDNYILFFAESGELKINSTLSHFFADAKIEGSENQKLYQNYLDTKKKILTAKNDLIRAQVLADKNNQEAASDSLLTLIGKTDKRMYLNAVNFSVKNKDKAVAAYIALTEVAPLSHVYLDTISNALTPEVKKSLYGKILTDYIEEVKSINQ